MAEEDESFSEWEQLSPSHSTASNSTTATQHNQEQENSNSSSASDETSSDSEEQNLQQHWYLGVTRHVRLSYETFCTKVVGLVDRSRCCKMGFGQFVSLSGVLIAVVVSLMYVKMRKLVDKLKEREVQLVALINSKDEKIRQLVVQLAHMNDLLSRRRKVPVLRIHQSSQSA